MDRTPPGVVANQLEFEKHDTESQRGLAASHTACLSARAFLRPVTWCGSPFWLGRNPAPSQAHAARPAGRFDDGHCRTVVVVHGVGGSGICSSLSSRQMAFTVSSGLPNASVLITIVQFPWRKKKGKGKL